MVLSVLFDVAINARPALRVTRDVRDEQPKVEVLGLSEWCGVNFRSHDGLGQCVFNPCCDGAGLAPGPGYSLRKSSSSPEMDPSCRAAEPVSATSA